MEEAARIQSPPRTWARCQSRGSAFHSSSNPTLLLPKAAPAQDGRSHHRASRTGSRRTITPKQSKTLDSFSSRCESTLRFSLLACTPPLRSRRTAASPCCRAPPSPRGRRAPPPSPWGRDEGPPHRSTNPSHISAFLLRV